MCNIKPLSRHKFSSGDTRIKDAAPLISKEKPTNNKIIDTVKTRKPKSGVSFAATNRTSYQCAYKAPQSKKTFRASNKDALKSIEPKKATTKSSKEISTTRGAVSRDSIVKAANLHSISCNPKLLKESKASDTHSSESTR